MPHYTQTQKIVAYIPRKQRRYICTFCGVKAVDPHHMISHLKLEHNKECEGFGYAIYEK